MAQLVREVMTDRPVCLPENITINDTARSMRDQGIGDVLVTDGNRIRGMVTDRDIVVRGLAEGHDPTSTTLSEIISRDIVTVSPDDPVNRAVELMRRYAVRRLPVCADGRPVGVVSLGDLAVERDPNSVLADISAASGNA